MGSQQNFRVGVEPFANPSAHGCLHGFRDRGVGGEVSGGPFLRSVLPDREIDARRMKRRSVFPDAVVASGKLFLVPASRLANPCLSPHAKLTPLVRISS